jgi:hypothetical protein
MDRTKRIELLGQPFPNIVSIPHVMRIDHDKKTAEVIDLSTGTTLTCCFVCHEPFSVLHPERTGCVNRNCPEYIAEPTYFDWQKKS